MVKYVAALDMGTTGLRMLVGKVTDSGSVHIIAKATMPCSGINKYQIENEQEVVSSIKKLLKRIEDQTDIIVKSTYVSIQGAYVGYVRNTAAVEVEGGVVTGDTIGDLLDKTSDIELYEDEYLIDVMPIKYIADEIEIINNPLGKEANSLRVEADILTANESEITKITNCLNEAGLEVDGFVPWTAAMTGLIPDYNDGENSTLLIDVGGSVTEFAVYNKNYPFFSASVPIGGNQISNDIAAVFNINKEEADTIKRDYSIAAAELVTNNVDVAVFNVEKGMQELVKIKDIVDVMEARIVDLMNIIADKIEKDDIRTDKIDRIIISGDGLSSFNGIEILVEDIFETKYVKVDFSRATGMKNCYTCASGMVMYISGLLPYGRMDSKIEKRNFGMEQEQEHSNSLFEGAKGKVMGWISRFKD